MSFLVLLLEEFDLFNPCLQNAPPHTLNYLSAFTKERRDHTESSFPIPLCSLFLLTLPNLFNHQLKELM